MEPNRDVIIVHAGVGRRSERNLKAISKLCEAAVQNARAKAAETRSATEAVVEAIQSLEKSPLTNAGIGLIFDLCLSSRIKRTDTVVQ